MNAPARLPATIARPVADPEAMIGIGEPGIAAVLWERPLDPAFAAWLDALPPERLPRLRAAMPHPRAREAVRTACESAGTPEGKERERLIDDIGALAQIFARVSGHPMVKIRLDVVQTDSCRKFHIDNIRLRLLCTYRGAGTEYGVAPRGETPERIERVQRATAALFRGRRWPGEATGMVHRSPPIAGTGETRLLLVIDPCEPDDEDD
jgi:hypothetical protein